MFCDQCQFKMKIKSKKVVEQTNIIRRVYECRNCPDKSVNTEEIIVHTGPKAYKGIEFLIDSLIKHGKRETGFSKDAFNHVADWLKKWVK